jgi:hypothetical protein
MQRLFINIGLIDIDRKGDLIDIIATRGGIPGNAIGKINMERRHTFFDVDDEYAKTIIKKFKDVSIEGRAIRVNAEGSGNSRGDSRSRDRDHKKKKKKWRN